MNEATLSKGRAVFGALVLSSMVYGCADGGVDGETANEGASGGAPESAALFQTDVAGVGVATARTDAAIVIADSHPDRALPVVVANGEVVSATSTSTSTPTVPMPGPAAALPDRATVDVAVPVEQSAAVEAVREAVELAEREEERLAALRIEEARLEAQRAEAERLALESARVEAERIEAERLAAERREEERVANEQERLAAELEGDEERAANLREQERLAAEAEAVRLAEAETARRLAAEEEAERLAAEAEAERLAAEKTEERLAAEREAERLAAEAEEETARLAEEEAARVAEEEAARLAEEEAARLAEEEAARLAEEEAARLAEEEAARLAEEEAARLAAEAQAGDAEVIKVGNAPGEARCLDLSEQESGFGSIDKGDWSAWAPDVRFSTGGEYLSLARGSDGRQTLRQKFVPASNGSARVIMGSDLAGARTYRIVQSFYLEPGWDWGGDVNQGGKMGFGVGGGTTPSGGKLDTAGFTARFMWKGNRDGTATARIYSYAADRPTVYGEDIVLEGFLLPIGEWFDLTMEITTNSSTGKSDGSVRAWANGELLVHRENMGWQTSGGTPLVENFYYSGFYGGNDPGWAPDSTTYMRLADVCWAAVVDGYSGIDPDIGQVRVPRDKDGSGGPGVFYDDVEPYVATARGIAVDAIEGARTRIEFMMPTDGDIVDGSLDRAIGTLNAALSPAHWTTDETLSIGAPPVLGLDAAIAELEQPWVSGSSSAAVRVEAGSVARELAVAAATLAEDMTSRAERAARVRGCLDGSGEAVCGPVRADVGAARSALAAMRLAEADSAEAADRAVEAWVRAVSALKGLSG